jgi:hypothetical protein
MPWGDSPLQPIIMTRLQTIQPSSMLKGTHLYAIGSREETSDIGEDTHIIMGIPPTQDFGDEGDNKII